MEKILIFEENEKRFGGTITRDIIESSLVVVRKGNKFEILKNRCSFSYVGLISFKELQEIITTCYETTTCYGTEISKIPRETEVLKSDEPCNPIMEIELP